MLRLLIDENIDHRILRGLLRRIPQLDFIVPAHVGLAGLADPELLRWAAREDRTILTHDVKTMPPYAKQLMAQGEPMAGVIVVPEQLGIGVAIADLELLLECLSQSDLRDRIMRLPL
jgi:predicted nuclease of predicted toxin-antitoxin system